MISTLIDGRRENLMEQQGLIKIQDSILLFNLSLGLIIQNLTPAILRPSLMIILSALGHEEYRRKNWSKKRFL